VRVESIRVDRWRNFSGLTLAVPPEARFVCLVGENGTGKSSLLELVTWAAHQIGIAAQVPLRRPIAAPEPGMEMSVEVVIDTEREDLREVIASISSASVRES
jgi:recombinational DNA repair ATPase RecF